MFELYTPPDGLGYAGNLKFESGAIESHSTGDEWQKRAHDKYVLSKLVVSILNKSAVELEALICEHDDPKRQRVNPQIQAIGWLPRGYRSPGRWECGKLLTKLDVIWGISTITSC